MPSESFVFLTQSHVANAPVQINDVHHVTENPAVKAISEESDNEHALSTKFKTSDRLFDILSSKSDIDHPICVECTELLIEGLKQQFVEARKDRDAYIEFLNQVQNEIPSKEEEEVAAKHLERIEREQASVLAELQKVESERRKVEEEVAELDRQSKELDEEESKFWNMRNAFADELEEFLSERDAVKMQYQYDVAQLERLRATNVYSDIFAIEGGSSAVNRMAEGRRR